MGNFEVAQAGTRERDDRPVPKGFNLLRWRALRTVVRSRAFPYAFQAATLAVFVGLAILGWGLYAPEGVQAKLYAQSNLVTLTIWGLWWPAMVWAAVLFGRVWCAVCPLELVSNLSERLGRRLSLPQRSLRKWMLSGGIMLALYLLIQLLLAGAQIHRVPAYTSLFLVGLLALAIGTGLIFKDRAFCRGFCPVGLLLSVYGRGGVLAIRRGSVSACDGCSDKACRAGRNRTRLDARACPSLLNPPQLEQSRDCLLCGQCLKSCGRDNMRFLLRKPFPASDRRTPLASWPATLFVMAVSGFVLWELTGEWKTEEAVFLALPERMAAWAGLEAWAGLVKGLWALLIVPAALWGLAGLTVKLLGGEGSFGTIWRRMALPVAVVVAAGHMSKGLAKFTSWAVYLPYAVTEPAGIETATKLTAKALPQPEPLLSLPMVAAVGAVLVLTGLVLAVREARLSAPEVPKRQHLTLATAAAVVLVLLTGWIWGTH